MTSALYARCLIPQAIGRELTYEIPQELVPLVKPGSRVQVPLRQGLAVALVMGIDREPPPGVALKFIAQVLDDTPFYDEAMLTFLKWVGDYYLASPGQVLRTALPGIARRPRKRTPRSGAQESCPAKDRSRGSEVRNDRELSRYQHDALDRINSAIDGGTYRPFLLHGVTGSGKTEIYLRAAAQSLAHNRGVIILVPEITLAYQIIDVFTERFGDMVSVLHSRLTDSERARALEEVRREPRIVVGARSAVFAPVNSLGLVVVDEEHEPAYKQEETAPFYHARECALMRGKLSGCPVILGSATPSMETATRAKAGHVELLSLPERVDSTPLPLVELIPMDREPAGTIISAKLAAALRETIDRGEQALVFLNRRGFAPVMLCTSCGATARCTRCSANLVLHVQESTLMCHWCGTRYPVKHKCPRCSGEVMRALGLGTQKVEMELRSLLPRARLVRMDQDTTRKNRLAHRDLLEQFSQGDVLVGTQMIAKGLDFPRLTLVGVVLADLSLAFPDFRAAERTFQLLTQVAGRAGRRNVRGRVLIQTLSPDHPAIEAAAGHDYWKQYEAEAPLRRSLGYPPFGRLVRFKFVGKDSATVERVANQALRILTSRLPPRASILGPAPAVPAMVAGKYRWHLTLKGPLRADLRSPSRIALEHLAKADPNRRVRVTVDIDPLNVMS